MRGCESVPTLHPLSQWRHPHVQQNLNRVGEHTPRQKLVTLVVKKPQRVLNQLRDFRVPQPAPANAAIQIFLQLQALFWDVFKLQHFATN
jgi:hypothetical protein